jgi:hypothetical protein
MSSFLNNFTLGTTIGASIAVGAASGLVVWAMEEAVSNEINKRPYLLPILGGLAGIGGTVAFIGLKTSVFG